MKLVLLLFVRRSELRTARWADIDLDACEWRYIATNAKTPHIGPIASQVVAILRELQRLTGRGEYLFPSVRSQRRPMRENTITAALHALGYDGNSMTGHGFRVMAHMILDEVLYICPDYIEHRLVHAVRDSNGRAYNRTAHLPARRAMIQQWADYLEMLKAEEAWCR